MRKWHKVIFCLLTIVFVFNFVIQPVHASATLVAVGSIKLAEFLILCAAVGVTFIFDVGDGSFDALNEANKILDAFENLYYPGGRNPLDPKQNLIDLFSVYVAGQTEKIGTYMDNLVSFFKGLGSKKGINDYVDPDSVFDCFDLPENPDDLSPFFVDYPRRLPLYNSIFLSFGPYFLSAIKGTDNYFNVVTNVTPVYGTPSSPCSVYVGSYGVGAYMRGEWKSSNGLYYLTFRFLYESKSDYHELQYQMPITRRSGGKNIYVLDDPGEVEIEQPLQYIVVEDSPIVDNGAPKTVYVDLSHVQSVPYIDMETGEYMNVYPGTMNELITDFVENTPIDQVVTTEIGTGVGEEIPGVGIPILTGNPPLDDPDPVVPDPTLPDVPLPNDDFDNPYEGADPTKQIDWSPLKFSGLLNKFPFCIPWDLKNAVSSLQADVKIPKWDIEIMGENLLIDFERFEAWAKIVRWGVLILFNIGLIKITRSLIRG